MNETQLSSDALNFKPSAIRAFAKLIKDPAVISFAGGMPSPSTFPGDDLARISEKVMRERGAIALQYGPTLGIQRLREAIVAICAGRSITTTVDEVLVTTGSQQALNLVAQ